MQTAPTAFDEKQCVALMESRGIRATANRIMIVKALAAGREPKTLKDLEATLAPIDKSNIFRSLVVFRERRLVHSIEGGDGSIRYELCQSRGGGKDSDGHVHFFCEECCRTICLHDVALPEILLPESFTARSANYLVKGVCPKCGGRNAATRGGARNIHAPRQDR